MTCGVWTSRVGVTGDGKKCEPFTLIDGASRYLLRCQAVMRTDVETVWPVLNACFYEFGLPLAIRSDNGPPFASVAAGRLSPLAVRLVKAGVLPDHIDPASPAQNGRLERLHRTLKQDTIQPAARSRTAQNRRFQHFTKVYNHQRPHEALAMNVPASHYQASVRTWSGRLRSPEYGQDVIVRRVRCNGEIKWNGQLLYISQTLAGEPISIDEQEHGIWTLRFGPVLLGTINTKNQFCKPPPRRRGGGLQNKEQSAKTVTHVAS
ncbi:MAG: transposase [Robiginitomaculum sp.]|nr:transposase [Robiginitomaculum sp.]